MFGRVVERVGSLVDAVASRVRSLACRVLHGAFRLVGSAFSAQVIISYRLSRGFLHAALALSMVPSILFLSMKLFSWSETAE
jgi:hypothetical protein